MDCLTPDNWTKMTPLTEEQRWLFLQHLKLVAFVYNRMIFTHLKNKRGRREDLFQEGYIGLGIAIQGYNGDVANFSTYACSIIRSRMYRSIMRTCKTYIVPFNTMMRDHHTLPKEVSKDAWGDLLIGSYRDPIITMVEQYDDETVLRMIKDSLKPSKIKR